MKDETKRIDMLVRISLEGVAIQPDDYKTARRRDAAHATLGSLLADGFVATLPSGIPWPTPAGRAFLKAQLDAMEATAAMVRKALDCTED